MDFIFWRICNQERRMISVLVPRIWLDSVNGELVNSWLCHREVPLKNLELIYWWDLFSFTLFYFGNSRIEKNASRFLFDFFSLKNEKSFFKLFFLGQIFGERCVKPDLSRSLWTLLVHPRRQWRIDRFLWSLILSSDLWPIAINLESPRRFISNRNSPSGKCSVFDH